MGLHHAVAESLGADDAQVVAVQLRSRLRDPLGVVLGRVGVVCRHHAAGDLHLQLPLGVELGERRQLFCAEDLEARVVGARETHGEHEVLEPQQEFLHLLARVGDCLHDVEDRSLRDVAGRRAVLAHPDHRRAPLLGARLVDAEAIERGRVEPHGMAVARLQHHGHVRADRVEVARVGHAVALHPVAPGVKLPAGVGGYVICRDLHVLVDALAGQQVGLPDGARAGPARMAVRLQEAGVDVVVAVVQDHGVVGAQATRRLLAAHVHDLALRYGYGARPRLVLVHRDNVPDYQSVSFFGHSSSSYIAYATSHAVVALFAATL